MHQNECNLTTKSLNIFKIFILQDLRTFLIPLQNNSSYFVSTEMHYDKSSNNQGFDKSKRHELRFKNRRLGNFILLIIHVQNAKCVSQFQRLLLYISKKN